MAKIHPRYYWALECMQLQPGNNVLELGCGAGLLLSAICPVITMGKVVGVDASAAMIAKATNRNLQWVNEGRLSLLHTDVASLKFQENIFDKVVAFNLNIFFKSDIASMDAITYGMKKNADLYIFYQPPYQATLSFMLPVIRFLKEQGFAIIQTQAKIFSTVPAFCVHARK
jgi:cyclopropane fatty-acyl-phospholipid synthase-like methyltransferase